MKRIAVAVGSRATFSSVQSVIKELGHSATVLAYGSALSDRYGGEAISWPFPTHRFTTLLDGGHAAATQTAALTMSQVGAWLAQQRPDCVLVNGDRTEQLAVAYAASILNIPVAHTMAGENSGSVDDKIRWAITALADTRFASTKLAAEACDGIWTGCPRIDHVKQTLESGAAKGFGPCVLVAFHPVTTEGDCGAQMRAVLQACTGVAANCGLETHACWPNSDPGSHAIVEELRRWPNIMTHRKLSPEKWTACLSECSVVVGNSSSPLREGAFIGVSAVNVGSRQVNRERADNVIDVPAVASEIACAIGKQLDHGRYGCSTLYGDGTAGRKIAEVLR